jgi:hypothetical protein
VWRRWIVRIAAPTPNHETTAAVVDSAVVPVAMAIGDDAPDGKADTEGNKRRGGAVDIAWWRSINDDRVVSWNVNHLRVGRDDLDDGIRHENGLGFIGPFDYGIRDNDHLLSRALQRAQRLSFLTKRLDGIHEFEGLLDKGLAELSAPCQIITHFLNHLRESRDSFYIVVPRLSIQRREVVGIGDEARSLNNFDRVSGCGQEHGQKWIRVQGDRSDELFQVSRAKCRGRRWRRGGIGLGV